jgi:hypothetical protein
MGRPKKVQIEVVEEVIVDEVVRTTVPQTEVIEHLDRDPNDVRVKR